ncbi:histidine kinase N-terminal 7TM domain-containing protein [Anaerolineales bacterium]
MLWQINLHPVPGFAAALIALLLAYLGWQRRRSSLSAYLFSFFMLAVAWWAFFETASLISTGAETKLFLTKLMYIGTLIVSPTWLALAMTHTGWQRYIRWRNTLMIAIPSLIIYFFILTTDQTGLFYSSYGQENLNGLWVFVFTRGPFYYLNIFYSYLLIFASLVLLLNAWHQAAGLRRSQLGYLILAISIPLTVNILYFTGVLDNIVPVTSAAFTLSGLIMLWNVYRYRLLDITPVARDILFDNLTNPVIVVDATFRVSDLNPAWTKIFGTTLDDSVGLPLLDAFGSYRDQFERYSDMTEGYAELNLSLNGADTYFELNISPIQKRNEVVGYLLILHDISERIKAEQAVEMAYLRQTVLRQVGSELADKLALDHVLDVAFEALLKLSRADCAYILLERNRGLQVVRVNSSASALHLNQFYDASRGIMGRVYKNGVAEWIKDLSQDPNYIEFCSGAKSQITIPLVSRARSMGVISIVTSDPSKFNRDLLEVLKVLAAQIGVALENAIAYEERGTLIAELDAYAHTVAHDLKNPLALMVGYISVLQDIASESENKLIDDYLANLYRVGYKMLNIVDELLLLASVRDNTAITRTDLDMNSIVQGAILRLSLMIEQSTAQIILPDEWDSAVGYAPWVEEVWANYISNAIKYGGKLPIIEMGSDTLANNQVRYWIKDNGPGLTPAQQANLFTPFIRLDTSKADGHGLGLSIVNRIIERLDGFTGVESQLGEGSIFYFTLPATLSELQPQLDSGGSVQR